MPRILLSLSARSGRRCQLTYAWEVLPSSLIGAQCPKNDPAEQRAAVAEERPKNRDEQLAEARHALEGQHKAAAEAQAHALAAAKELSAAQRELLVCQNERAALAAAKAGKEVSASEGAQKAGNKA